MSKKLRPVTVIGDVVEVPLASGGFAITDAALADVVGRYNWSRAAHDSVVYAVANEKVGHRKFRTLRMHRLVLGAKPGDLIDHVNGCGLDNRLSNLRFATRAQNGWNAQASSLNTSGVRGVHWNKSDRRWVATITANRKRHFLGNFRNLDEAAEAYAAAARALHGEFRRAG